MPHECNNIEEARKEIDAIDYKIMKMFGLRFQYVKNVVKFKEKTPESIIAAERKKIVIEKRREWAVENNLDPDVFEGIFMNLIEYFIAEEMKIVNIKPDK